MIAAPAAAQSHEMLRGYGWHSLSNDPIITIVTPTWPCAEAAAVCQAYQAYQAWRVPVMNEVLCRRVASTATDVQVAPDVTYQELVAWRSAQWTGRDFTPQVVSVIAHLVTIDGWTVLQYRDSGDWLAGYELPGGFLRARHTHASLKTFIEKRTREDIGLETAELQFVDPVAILDAPSIGEWMGVYRIAVKRTRLMFTTRDSMRYQLLPPAFSKDDITRLAQSVPLHPPTRTVLHELATT